MENDTYLVKPTQSKDDCAVFQLPNELMGQIHQLLSPPTLSGPKFDERSYPAFALSHTCKRWRSSILSYPECWRWIPCTNTHWLDEGLRRSEGALLHFFIDIKTLPALTKTAARLIDHTARVECVYLGERVGTRHAGQNADRETSVVSHYSRDGSSAYDALISLLKPIHPSIREVYLMQWYSQRVRMAAIPPILGAWYSRFPPLLQRLVVSDANLGTRTWFFKAPLTHLEVLRGSLWMNEKDMMNCFRALRQLEVFIARDCLSLYSGEDDIDDQPDHPPRCINIPALRQFTCVGSRKESLRIFELLSVPVSCSVHIGDAEPFDAYHRSNLTDWRYAFRIISLHLESIFALALDLAKTNFCVRHRYLPQKRAMEFVIHLSYIPGAESSETTIFELIVYVDDMYTDEPVDIMSALIHLTPYLSAHTPTLRAELTDSGFEPDDAISAFWKRIEEVPGLVWHIARKANNALWDRATRGSLDPNCSFSIALPNLAALAADCDNDGEKRYPKPADLAVLVQREEKSPIVEVAYT